MNTRPVHTGFTQLHRPTARCDECDKKSHKVINRCTQCTQQFCNECVDTGTSSHKRSAEDAAKAADVNPRNPPTITPAKRKVVIKTTQPDGDDEITGDIASKPSTPKNIGSFRTSPQAFKKNPFAATSTHAGDSAARNGEEYRDSIEYTAILNKPWNTGTPSKGYAAGLDYNSSDMTSGEIARTGDDLRRFRGEAMAGQDHDKNKQLSSMESPHDAGQDPFMDSQTSQAVDRGQAASDASLLRAVFGFNEADNTSKAPESSTAPPPKAKKRRPRRKTKAKAPAAVEINETPGGLEPELAEEDPDPDAPPILLAELEMHEARVRRLKEDGWLDPKPATKETLMAEVTEGYYWDSMNSIEAPSQFMHTISSDPRGRVPAAKMPDILNSDGGNVQTTRSKPKKKVNSQHTVHETAVHGSASGYGLPKIAKATNGNAAPAYASEATKKLFATNDPLAMDGANIDLLLLAAAELEKATI